MIKVKIPERYNVMEDHVNYANLPKYEKFWHLTDPEMVAELVFRVDHLTNSIEQLLIQARQCDFADLAQQLRSLRHYETLTLGSQMLLFKDREHLRLHNGS